MAQTLVLPNSYAFRPPLRPEPETVTFAPSQVPNFRDRAGALNGRHLPIGLDMNAAGLSSLTLEEFPPGRHVAFVLQHGIPDLGIDRSRVLERLDLTRLRTLVDNDAADWLHVVLHIGMGAWNAGDEQRFGWNFGFTLEELWSHPDADEVLAGPWTVWGDVGPTYLVSNLSTRSVGDFEGAPGLFTSFREQQLACLEDGIVVGSVGDYWFLADDDWFLLMIDECLSGRMGVDWTPVELDEAPVPAPTFELGNRFGEVLRSEDLLGEPFIVLAPAPITESAVQATMSPRPALEPGPELRLEQVQDALRRVDLDYMPVIVLALPFVRDDLMISATDVADMLRRALDVPVFEDVGGAFLMRYSQQLHHSPSAVLVFDDAGRLVGRFSDFFPAAALDFFARDLDGVLESLSAPPTGD